MDLTQFIALPYFRALFVQDKTYSDFEVMANTLGVNNIPKLIIEPANYINIPGISCYRTTDNVIYLYTSGLNILIQCKELNIPYINKQECEFIIRNARMFALCHELVHALQNEQGRLPKYIPYYFTYDDYVNSPVEKEANMKALEYCKMYGD